MARRFHFPLETLLRVRQLREREARRRVAAKQAEIARLDQLDRDADEQIRGQQAVLLATQSAGHFDPQMLQRGRAWIAHLRKTIVLRDVQRAGLRQELQKFQAEFALARQKTRVLEKLRERRFADHRRRAARRDQAASDELAQQLHVFRATELMQD